MNNISKWIKDYVVKYNIKSLVVGVSGGIDSALVSTLCCETGVTTYVVSMPILQKEDQLTRASNHLKWLSDRYPNCKCLEIDLSKTFIEFSNLFSADLKTNLSLANTRSRIRMISLYQISGSVNGIVVGTGNKIEDFGVGFFTKYGDGGVDISPIGDLTKTEVRELSKEMGIIKEIIEANPTDGLWDDNRTDEQQMGASYEDLEWAMSFKGRVSELSEDRRKILSIYKRLNKVNRHKMKKIPIYKNDKQ